MEQPNFGASSQRQCQPCSKGYYSDEEGTELCKACPNGLDCIIGATNPVLVYQQENEHSQQPKNYQNKQNDMNNYSSQINISVASMIVILGLLFLSKSQIKDKLKMIDLFEKNHNYELNQFMKLMKTSIGGLFSSFFIVLASALILNNILNYIFDNIIESKALIPYLIMKESYPHIQADLRFIFKFSSYQGMCQSKESLIDEFTDCNKEIDYIQGGFSKDSDSNYWAPIKCKKVKEDCYVSIYCQSCEVTGPSFIQLNLQEEKSYSSSIQFNVTSTSSIPNEVSSIDIIIDPDLQMIFRGPEPTILEVLIIPSAYETNDPQQQKYDGQTGYHVMNSGYYYKGTQFSSTEMQFSSNLYARINLKPSESSLLTKQTLKTSAFTLITAVLGSVFGLMGVIGKIMSYIEKQQIKRNKKIQKVMDMAKNENFIRQINYLREQYNINPLQQFQKKGKRFSVKKVRKKTKERSSSHQVIPSYSIDEMYEDCYDNFSPLQQHLDLLKQQQKNKTQIQNTSTEYQNSVQFQGISFTFPANSQIYIENKSQKFEFNKKKNINEDSKIESLIIEDIE